MNIFSAIVVYVVIWWLVLFCTLPLDIKPITKTSDGSMPGAPVKHGMKRKAILTTAIATVIWIIALALIHANLISYRDIAARMDM
jgi:predicted secreted protein